VFCGERGVICHDPDSGSVVPARWIYRSGFEVTLVIPEIGAGYTAGYKSTGSVRVVCAVRWDELRG